MACSSDEVAHLNAARDYAWKWFDLHAKQRIEVVRLGLFLYAFLVAGGLASIQGKFVLSAVVFLLIYCLVSVLFLALDVRTQQLIKTAERFLSDEEVRLAALLGNKNIRLLSFAATEKPSIMGIAISYGRVLRTFYILNAVGSGVGVVIIIACPWVVA